MSGLVLRRGADAIAALRSQLAGGRIVAPDEDLVLCLDTSGSMGARGKMGAMRQAAGDLIRLSLRSEVGIVKFSDSARLMNQDWRHEDALANVGLLADPWGGTNILAGAVESARALLARGTAARVRRVILMSDGCNGFQDPIPLVEEYAGMGIVFDTVAFGTDADEAMLRAIAQAGHGEFRAAGNAAALVRQFRSLEAGRRGLLPPAAGR